ncbi:MAG: ABC transporter permease [Clostridia bacterium]|nr:ABC transporter permease [Clostridia bacterium]
MIFLIQKTLIFTIPLLIVALAGMYAERSGIINIALDGIMIFGSFVGAVGAFLLRKVPFFVDHNQLTFILALLIAAISGALFSLLLSFSAIKLKADQTIGGTALNMLAPAIALFLIKVFFKMDRLEMTPAVNSAGQNKDFSFVILNNDMPDAGKVFFDKAYLSTFIAIAIYIILSIFIYKTKTGLRLRACGEHPQAAASVGIDVNKMRYLGTTISGALAGFGGYAYIATVANGTAEGTVAGMGFLALAIMIFGNWKPLGIALGALLFGFLKCVSVIYPQLSVTINGEKVFFLKNLNLPMYFYNLIPYVTVLIVLAFTSKRSRAPKAEGIPYDKGMR